MTSIIIPYRDRLTHLNILTPRLSAIAPEAEILVIEQGDSKAFNRGKLLNIGAKYARSEVLVMHDVDKIPMRDFWYGVPYYYHVNLIEKSSIQTHGYLGGVTCFRADTFRNLINGYSNNFWGWGGEDNELAFRLQSLHLEISYNIAVFDSLPHKPNGTFDPAKWRQALQPRAEDDGYNNCTYEVLAIERYDFYTKITVNL